MRLLKPFDRELLYADPAASIANLALQYIEACAPFTLCLRARFKLLRH